MIQRVIKKVLIANRGEIASAIVREAEKMGIQSVVVYTADDLQLNYLNKAHKAILIEGNNLSDTYLNIDLLLNIAISNQCDAIHPGYGFLAENAKFARDCLASGLIWIGPFPETITLMGDKYRARNFVKNLGYPVPEGRVGNVQELSSLPNIIHFPTMIKACAGGGGKGMHIARNKADYEAYLPLAAKEAKMLFGDDTLLVESFVADAKHIEVQVFGDMYGNVVHVGDRDCSVQRRYQKIIEEAPSASISHKIRQQLLSAAVDIAKKSGYINAGTIEFIVSNDEKWYFLEMNTRIQVEHPVTEEVYCVNLISEQFKIAMGYPLSIRVGDSIPEKHAVECRIYAEDWQHGFIPSMGNFELITNGIGRDVRIETAFNGNSNLSSSYDALLAKVIVCGSTRNEAIDKMSVALKQMIVTGIVTNIPYLLTVVNSDYFIRATFNTRLCDEKTIELVGKTVDFKNQFGLPECVATLLVKELLIATFYGKNKSFWYEPVFPGRKQFLRVENGGGDEIASYRFESNSSVTFWMCNKEHTIQNVCVEPELSVMNFTYNNLNYRIGFNIDTANNLYYRFGFQYVICKNKIRIVERQSGTISGSIKNIKSPLPGKVLSVLVKMGDKVNKGDLLLVIESMKIENNVMSQMGGIIKEVLVSEKEQISTGQTLVQMEIDNQ